MNIYMMSCSCNMFGNKTLRNKINIVIIVRLTLFYMICSAINSSSLTYNKISITISNGSKHYHLVFFDFNSWLNPLFCFLPQHIFLIILNTANIVPKKIPSHTSSRSHMNNANGHIVLAWDFICGAPLLRRTYSHHQTASSKGCFGRSRNNEDLIAILSR